jgi:hypothetical protein
MTAEALIAEQVEADPGREIRVPGDAPVEGDVRSQASECKFEHFPNAVGALDTLICRAKDPNRLIVGNALWSQKHRQIVFKLHCLVTPNMIAGICQPKTPEEECACERG